MKIPSGYDTITIKQWMDSIVIVNDDSLDKLDKDTQLIALFTGYTIEYINDDMPINEFAELRTKLKFLHSDIPLFSVTKSIKINGKTFAPILDLANIKVNQIMDYFEVMRQHENKVEKCAHNLLAIIYTEQGKAYFPEHHTEQSEIFLKQKFSSVIGAVFFYTSYWQNVERIIQTYMAKNMQIVNERMAEIEANKELIISYQTGDGSMQSTNAQKMQG